MCGPDVGEHEQRDLYLAVTRLIADFQIASTKPAFDCAAMITAQLLRYSPRERSQIVSALRAVLDIVGTAPATTAAAAFQGRAGHGKQT